MDTIESRSIYEQNFMVLMPDKCSKDMYSRFLFFLDWLDNQKIPWYRPTLSEYKNYLLNQRTRIHPRTGQVIDARLSPASANAHLATIRGRYRALLSSNQVRDWIYNSLPAGIQDPASRKALVDELLTRIEHDINPVYSSAKQIKLLDEPDKKHIRLTSEQVLTLIRTPGIDRLTTLRDTAMITLMVCTGIREGELVALKVDDLRQTFGGELALLVRQGKDSIQRMIPYGVLEWCLVYVERWLKAADITHGAVFRGVFRGDKRVRKTGITERAVHQIMHRYPIAIDDVMTVINPHDLRRTYAYNAYVYGMDIERIRQNLGHNDIKTTQLYIGRLDGKLRRPPWMFALPHSMDELSQPLQKNAHKTYN